MPGCTNPTYCISNTGYLYDDNYMSAGTYDGETYWTGSTNGYVIYYNTGNTQWCLSTVTGGTCLLFGKTPCTSLCPDLCYDFFTSGICPSPTPTPTINCDTLDFEAIFNCEVSPTPTVTPTLTPTPSITPTLTPTQECGYLNIDLSISAYTPTTTPTPTITPTSSQQITRPFNFSGDVTFTTVDSNIRCPNSTKFQDCYSGEIYNTTDILVLPVGVYLEPFMIFKANVNGQTKCISYLDVDNNTIGTDTIEIIEGPLGFSNLGECVLCQVK